MAISTAGVHAFLFLLGVALASDRLGQVSVSVRDIDKYAFTHITSRFEPVFAPGLLAAVGPGGFLYLLISLCTLGLALIQDWRSLLPAGVRLALALVLSLELLLLGGVLPDRAAPLSLYPDAPVSAEWRAAWSEQRPGGIGFPTRHALMTSALCSVLALTWLPGILPALALALSAVFVEVYFGQAWLTDSAGSMLAGTLVAAVSSAATKTLLAWISRSKVLDLRRSNMVTSDSRAS